MWFSNWGKKRGFGFVSFFKHKMCKAWSEAGFSLPIRAVDAGPGLIRRLGHMKACREALEIVKPGKKSSLSLRSPYVFSQIILVHKVMFLNMSDLHKVSSILLFPNTENLKRLPWVIIRISLQKWSTVLMGKVLSCNVVHRWKSHIS